MRERLVGCGAVRPMVQVGGRPIALEPGHEQRDPIRVGLHAETARKQFKVGWGSRGVPEERRRKAEDNSIELRGYFSMYLLSQTNLVKLKSDWGVSYLTDGHQLPSASVMLRWKSGASRGPVKPVSSKAQTEGTSREGGEGEGRCVCF